MDHALAFLLLGALWALCIGIAWLLLLQIPRLRKESPHAWRGPVSLIIGAGLLGALSVGMNLLYQSATFGAEVAATTPPGITIESDPPGAHTFIEGRYVGTTPVAIDIRGDREHTYIIAADPREYQPFAGRITPETFGNIAVWLDRRAPEEESGTEKALLIEHINVEAHTVGGTVEHQGVEPHLYVLITFAHYGADGAHLGDSMSLLRELEPNEVRPFTSANPHIGTSTVEVIDVSPLDP